MIERTVFQCISIAASPHRECGPLLVPGYADEPKTIAAMKAFARQQGLSLSGLHWAVYLRFICQIRTILNRPSCVPSCGNSSVPSWIERSNFQYVTGSRVGGCGSFFDHDSASLRAWYAVSPASHFCNCSSAFAASVKLGSRRALSSYALRASSVRCNCSRALPLRHRAWATD